MTREDHLANCKKHAHEYLARGELANAVTSMMSDMDKHPETKIGPSGALNALGLMAMTSDDTDFVRRYIDGFR